MARANDFTDADLEAWERASEYAPLPALEPINGALNGAVAAAIIATAFAGVAHIDLAHHVAALALTVILASAGAFLRIRSQKARHYSAFLRERDVVRLRALADEQDAKNVLKTGP